MLFPRIVWRFVGADADLLILCRSEWNMQQQTRWFSGQLSMGRIHSFVGCKIWVIVMIIELLNKHIFILFHPFRCPVLLCISTAAVGGVGVYVFVRHWVFAENIIFHDAQKLFHVVDHSKFMCPISVIKRV